MNREKPTGFMEYTREVPRRPVPVERIKDWQEVYLPMPGRSCAPRRARCMDCGVPFCQAGIDQRLARGQPRPRME